MPNKSQYAEGDLNSPCGSAAAVTPSDSVNLTGGPTRALFVGGAGALSCLMVDDTTCVFTGVVAGAVLALRVKRVNSTGTTATNIVAMW